VAGIVLIHILRKGQLAAEERAQHLDLTRNSGNGIFGLLRLKQQSAGQVKIVIPANYDDPIGFSAGP
jgi:hypothetical protein